MEASTQMEKTVSEGKVVESLPNLISRVELKNGELILAYSAGKMRMNKIKVLVGDRVMVELDPSGGHATNRIIRRL